MVAFEIIITTLLFMGYFLNLESSAGFAVACYMTYCFIIALKATRAEQKENEYLRRISRVKKYKSERKSAEEN